MIGRNLLGTYATLLGMGLVRNKRQFSRNYLARHWTYLRDFEVRDRDGVRVSARTVATLRARLRAVARLLPQGLRKEVEQVVEDIDRHTRIADTLGYSRQIRG